MGLFDKLFGNKENNNSDSKEIISPLKQNDISNPNEIEKAITEHFQNINLSQCIRIPFSEIAMLGSSFAQMLPSLRTVTQSVTMDGMGYIPINNLSGEALKAFRKSTPDVFIGMFKDANTGKSVAAKLVKAGPQTVSSTAMMPINPAGLLMAAMLVKIEKQLIDIQVTQQKILSF
ncbi:MAG: hypothetical protein IKH57_26355 [Clostridia bacterium]|nr:hypothetical protein [Clostridia bacterium]